MSGKPVKSLNSQLRGYSFQQIIESCVDNNYKEFFEFIKVREWHYLSNVGTILSKIPIYAGYEQIFSAGLRIKNVKYFKTSKISNIPKSLIKICKKYNIGLTDDLIEFYSKEPDAYFLAFNTMEEYRSLTPAAVDKELTHLYCGGMGRTSAFLTLIKEYGYTPKALMMYIDNLYTYEAFTECSNLIGEILDYAKMMKCISNKFEKYPKNFATTFRIACRNYNRMKEVFKEKDFQKRIDTSMEHTFGDWQFIYPKSTQEIKDEAAQQNNCVVSYIQYILDGRCDILFLRRKSDPTKSVVTIEVRDNQIVQALEKYNRECDAEEKQMIAKWNELHAKDIRLVS